MTFILQLSFKLIDHCKNHRFLIDGCTKFLTFVGRWQLLIYVADAVSTSVRYLWLKYTGRLEIYINCPSFANLLSAWKINMNINFFWISLLWKRGHMKYPDIFWPFSLYKEVSSDLLCSQIICFCTMEYIGSIYCFLFVTS